MPPCFRVEEIWNQRSAFIYGVSSIFVHPTWLWTPGSGGRFCCSATPTHVTIIKRSFAVGYEGSPQPCWFVCLSVIVSFWSSHLNVKIVHEICIPIFAFEFKDMTTYMIKNLGRQPVPQQRTWSVFFVGPFWCKLMAKNMHLRSWISG